MPSHKNSIIVDLGLLCTEGLLSIVHTLEPRARTGA